MLSQLTRRWFLFFKFNCGENEGAGTLTMEISTSDWHNRPNTQLQYPRVKDNKKEQFNCTVICFYWLLLLACELFFADIITMTNNFQLWYTHIFLCFHKCFHWSMFSIRGLVFYKMYYFSLSLKLGMTGAEKLIGTGYLSSRFAYPSFQIL